MLPGRARPVGWPPCPALAPACSCQPRARCGHAASHLSTQQRRSGLTGPSACQGSHTPIHRGNRGMGSRTPVPAARRRPWHATLPPCMVSQTHSSPGASTATRSQPLASPWGRDPPCPALAQAVAWRVSREHKTLPSQETGRTAPPAQCGGVSERQAGGWGERRPRTGPGDSAVSRHEPLNPHSPCGGPLPLPRPVAPAGRGCPQPARPSPHRRASAPMSSGRACPAEPRLPSPPRVLTACTLSPPCPGTSLPLPRLRDSFPRTEVEII